jgi:hypothetical protein
MYSITPDKQAARSRLLSTKIRPTSQSTNPGMAEELAQQFASRLPRNKFSTAEIQGDLLKKKKELQGALNDENKWRDDLLKPQKKGGGGRV